MYVCLIHVQHFGGGGFPLGFVENETLIFCMYSYTHVCACMFSVCTCTLCTLTIQQQNLPGSSSHSKLLTFGSTVDESYKGMDIKQEHQKRFSGLSPVISSANLTPERFQQPVMMLNSLQQQGHMQMSPAANAVSTGGHVMGPGSTSAGNPMMSSWMGGHMTSVANDVAAAGGVGGGGAGMVGVVNQQMMSPYGAKLERFGKPGDEKRRRSSSTSGPPLDDQGEWVGIRGRGGESVPLGHRGEAVSYPSLGKLDHTELVKLLYMYVHVRCVHVRHHHDELLSATASYIHCSLPLASCPAVA